MYSSMIRLRGITFVVLLALLAFTPVIPGARGADGPGPFAGQLADRPASVIPASVSSIDNFGVVDDGVYRGGQPDERGYRSLKEMGVRCVLNLRNDRDEEDAVRDAGMIPLCVPMGVFRNANAGSVEKAVALMADPANRPIYVHCRLGQDRTGVVVAVYRMKVDGWGLAEAEDEMQSYGFNDLWVNLKRLLHRMADEMARGTGGA